VTAWEHRTVVVTMGDDGPVNEMASLGWEPYAAVAAELLGGPGALDAIKVAIFLRRATRVA
jgi:hypothetical protein